MPDELGAHRQPVVCRRLEGEQAQDGVNGSRDAVHAPPAPGPHLRTDILNRGDTTHAQPLRKADVEGRGIHADEDIDAARKKCALQPATQAQQSRQMPQGFHQPHDGDLFR